MAGGDPSEEALVEVTPTGQAGWHPDPFGLHEMRHFSAAGEPTRLVRDQGVESYDEPPETPPRREVVSLGVRGSETRLSGSPTESAGEGTATEHRVPNPATPSAGWYRDARDPNNLRYWNGTSWTEELRQAPIDQPGIRTKVRDRGRSRSGRNLGLIGGALIVAVVVGFLIAGHSPNKPAGSTNAASHAPISAPNTSTTAATTTTSQPTEAQQMDHWWNTLGKTPIQIFGVDLIAIAQQAAAGNVAGVEEDCAHLSAASSGDGMVNLGPPIPALQAEWRSIVNNVVLGSEVCSTAPYLGDKFADDNLDTAYQELSDLLTTVDPMIGINPSG